MTGDRSDEHLDGIEERLRSSLRAYADLVDAPATEVRATEVRATGVRATGVRATGVPATGVRATPAASRRPAVRRWRGAALVAAAAAAVVTGTVWFATGDRSDPVAGAVSGSERSSAAASGGDSMAAAEAAPGGPADEATSPPGVAVGTGYPVDLYTHCGVLGIDIGGVWFAADPPLVEEYGPPSGWGNPDQPGTVTLLAADRAVFRDDAGHEVGLRADDAARPPPCA